MGQICYRTGKRLNMHLNVRFKIFGEAHFEISSIGGKIILKLVVK
jgi:hypothetical protein